MAGGAVRAGRAFVAFFTDNSAFDRGLKAMQLRLSGFGAGIRSMGSNLLAFTGIGGLISGALAPLIGGAAFVAGIRGALNFGSVLTDLQNRTGGSARSLQILQKAFDLTGIGADQVGPSINRLQKVLAAPTKSQTAVIKGLGLSFESLLTLDPASQFEKVGAAISAIENPARRTAAATALFGRGGGGLLALFRDSDSFALASQLLGNQVEIFSRRAPMFDHLSDVFNSWPEKLRGLWAGVADGFAPVLEQAANMFSGLDLSGFGQRFGETLTSGVFVLQNAITENRIGELLSISMKLAFAEAANFLTNAISVSLETIRNLISNPDFWKGAQGLAHAVGKPLFGLLDPLNKRVFAALEKARDPTATWGQALARGEQVLSEFKEDAAAGSATVTALPDAIRSAAEAAAKAVPLVATDEILGFRKELAGAWKELNRPPLTDAAGAAAGIPDMQNFGAGVLDWRKMVTAATQQFADMDLRGQGYGTFSAAVASRFGAGESTAEKIAKNTQKAADQSERTADAVEDMRDEAGVIG